MVGLVEIAVDGGLEVDDGSECAALQASLGERGEEGLDRVEPGAQGQPRCREEEARRPEPSGSKAGRKACYQEEEPLSWWIRLCGLGCFPRAGLFGFRDLASARQIAKLLRAGVALSTVIHSLHEIRRWLPDGSLANLRLHAEQTDVQVDQAS